MQIEPQPWFSLFMAIPFFVTTGALHLILFKPLIAYLQARDAAIGGARDEAEKLEAATNTQLEQLEAHLVTARAAAAEIRHSHREAGLSVERSQIEAARKQAEQQVSKAVDEIAAEAESARASLGGLAHSISVDIAGRVLGRGIQA